LDFDFCALLVGRDQSKEEAKTREYCTKIQVGLARSRIIIESTVYLGDEASSKPVPQGKDGSRQAQG